MKEGSRMKIYLIRIAYNVILKGGINDNKF